MKINFILKILSLLIISVLGKKHRISGGQAVSKGQFPFFAQLVIGHKFKDYRLDFFRCGGTLIQPKWILSAAHCFNGSIIAPPEMYKKGFVIAYMGSDKVIYRIDDNDFITQPVEKAYIHPEYFYKNINNSDYVRNDVAVALLKKAFTITQYVKTVRLPDKSTSLCQSGVVIGGGYVGFADEKGKLLKYATVETKTVDQVSLKPILMNRTVFFTEIQWYQGHPLKGDSGGPFVCDTQIGVVQYGIISNIYNNSIKQSLLTEYESVDQHMKFIESVLESNNKIKTSQQNDKRAVGVNKQNSSSFLKRTNRFLSFSVTFHVLCCLRSR